MPIDTEKLYREALEIITNAVQTDKMTAEQDKALAVVQKALETQILTAETSEWGEETCNFDFDEEDWE